jgi:hypothetical protein
MDPKLLMQLSRTPDLGPWRRMVLAGLGAAIAAAATLIFRDDGGLSARLGDTDDAMRLVLMRTLLDGQGWYDQMVHRLQPPLGVYMHWSRLIDGGLAALTSLFRLGLSPANAELATRFVWPLLWIAPATIASTAVARRLGAGAAVFACAIIMAVDVPMFLQFRPGRVDHHNLQITLCMLSLAGAALGSVRGALLAGLATGLALAIGLEALTFEVIVGVWFALRYPLGDDQAGRNLRAYAAALGLSAVAFFLIQTPPWRWEVAACDAVALNLIAAVVLACAGVVATVTFTRRSGWAPRLGALAAVGVASAAVYAGLDPNCLKGPFADVDVRLRTFWLPNVQEIRPIPRVWRSDHSTVLTLLAPMALGAAAWLYLARDPERRRDPFLILCGLCLLAGSITGWNAIRMAGYANWFAAPLIAAAVVKLSERYARGMMLATAVGACAAAPVVTGAAAIQIDKAVKAATKPAPKAAVKAAIKAPQPRGARGDRCFQTAAFADLARRPAGIVLSEIDLGPFILAHTKSSAMAAPYHRMNWGLVESRAVLSTPAEAAVAGARKLGATYVLECPTHARNADRSGMPADSLQKRLDRNQPPAWLEPLSTSGSLRLYRVRAAAPTPAGGAP